MTHSDNCRASALLRVLSYLKIADRTPTSNRELAAILYLAALPDLVYGDVVPDRSGVLVSDDLLDDLYSLAELGYLGSDTGPWTPLSASVVEWLPPPSLVRLLSFSFSPQELVVLARAIYENRRGKDAMGWIQRSLVSADSASVVCAAALELLGVNRSGFPAVDAHTEAEAPIVGGASEPAA